MPSKFCTSWIFLQIVSLCFVFLLFLGYSFNDPYTRPLSQCSSDRVIMFTNCCSQTTRRTIGMDQLYALRRRILTTYAQLISPLVITRLHDLNIHRRRGRRGGQGTADPSEWFCRGPASPKVHLRVTETVPLDACLSFRGRDPAHRWLQGRQHLPVCISSTPILLQNLTLLTSSQGSAPATTRK